MQDEVGDAVQDIGGSINLIEGVTGIAMRFDRRGACFFQPV